MPGLEGGGGGKKRGSVFSITSPIHSLDKGKILKSAKAALEGKKLTEVDEDDEDEGEEEEEDKSEGEKRKRRQRTVRGMSILAQTKCTMTRRRLELIGSKTLQISNKRPSATSNNGHDRL